mgnify:CR=1 FL=1
MFRCGVGILKAVIKTYLYHLGTILLANSVFLLVPGIYGFFFIGEHEVASTYLTVGAILLIIGFLLRKLLMPIHALTVSSALALVVLSWIIIPITGGIVLHYTSGMPLLDSLFEGVSGFTGTGLTMVTKPEEFPRTVLLWRSIMQWVGGLGIVVISLVLLARGIAVVRLALAEGREERIEPSIRKTAEVMLKIYVVITAISIVLFLITGMEPFDAVNHAMTGIATGGFSTHSKSVGYYRSLPIWWAGIIIMFMGAINFVDYSRITRLGIRHFFASIEVQSLIVIGLSGGLLLYLILSRNNTPSLELYTQTIFHAVSGMTNTGFQVASIVNYPDVAKALLIMLMVIGGSTSSTSAGIKHYRLLVFLKSIGWEITRTILPRGTTLSHRLGDRYIDEDVIRKVTSFIVLYLMTLAVGSLVTAAIYYAEGINVKFIDVLFEVTSAQTCTGLSVGLAGPHMPAMAKAVFIIIMLLGRLEIYPLIAVLWRPMMRYAKYIRG